MRVPENEFLFVCRMYVYNLQVRISARYHDYHPPLTTKGHFYGDSRDPLTIFNKKMQEKGKGARSFS